MTITHDPYVERDARAAELGWAWLSDNRCPRRLVGKHCRNRYTTGGCWCSTLGGHHNRLNDHAATWRDTGNRPAHGTQFVLWEPYGAHGAELVDVINAAQRDGLRVHIVASVWNPPSTIGIAFNEAV